jgi:hypothetical protein
MNQNNLFIGLITALVVGLILYLIGDFHKQLKEIESRLDYTDGYEKAQSETGKTPCGCGGH